MSNKTTLSISEARKKIFDIAEDVQKPGMVYTFTEKGKPKAVFMSYDEYDSLMENLELMSDPKFLQKIKKSEQEFKKGQYSSWADVKKSLGLDKLQPLLVADKPKRKYTAKKGR